MYMIYYIHVHNKKMMIYTNIIIIIKVLNLVLSNI